MRHFLYIFFCLVTLVSVSGCDMFRKLAKRPTSEELEAIRKKIEADKAKSEDTVVLDSVESQVTLDEQAQVESGELEAEELVEKIRSAGINIFGPSTLGKVEEGETIPAYCVVLGAFGSPDNVQRLCNKISDAGYKPLTIKTTGSLIIVAAEPSDNLSTVFESYKKISQEAFFPVGAWILSSTK